MSLLQMNSISVVFMADLTTLEFCIFCLYHIVSLAVNLFLSRLLSTIFLLVEAWPILQLSVFHYELEPMWQCFLCQPCSPSLTHFACVPDGFWWLEWAGRVNCFPLLGSIFTSPETSVLSVDKACSIKPMSVDDFRLSTGGEEVWTTYKLNYFLASLQCDLPLDNQTASTIAL